MFALTYAAFQFGGLAIFLYLLEPTTASATWLLPLNWLISCHTAFSIIGYKYRFMIPYDTSDEKVNKAIMMLLFFWVVSVIGTIALWKGGVTWR